MSNDGMGECRTSAEVCLGTGTSENRSGPEEKSDHLLPRIPNEITIDQICTKLPWTAFYSLSLVSTAWRRAIRSNSIYDARVRSNSTDTLLVHNHYRDQMESFAVVAVYSMRDRCCYELPAIPGEERGIPWSCECIALNGKIYVLGGATEYDLEEPRSMVEKKYHYSDEDDEKEVHKEVYVMDLAGQRQWTQCESMLEGRHRFACGVMNGKIYVFGGAGSSGPVHGCEVYDPKVRAWSPVKPMPSLRYWGHRVASLGSELCVYGGVYYDEETAKYAEEHPYDNHEWLGYDFTEEALTLDVYDPRTDEWRVVDPFLRNGQSSRTIFGERGKLHMMTQQGVYVFVNEKSEWEVLQTNSFAPVTTHLRLGPTIESVTVVPIATAIVNDVIFAGVGWDDHGEMFRRRAGICLLEGRGFGSKNEEITWEIIARCLCDPEGIMFAMQL